MRTMTVAIASHQRREPLLLLLADLESQLEAAPELAEGLDVVVVLDGSTDGSDEAVGALRMPVPVTCHLQPHRGLAATRNVALRVAGGEIIWFLDDDLRLGPELVRSHRVEHEKRPDHLMLGPCRPDPSSVAAHEWLRWWDRHLGELSQAGVVDRFDRFTVANLSGPVEVFRSAGGFDENFADYGMEDHELGCRILSSGVTVRFCPDAVALHAHVEGERIEILRERAIARNTILLARRHPATLPTLFPGGDPGLANRLLGWSRLRSPNLLAGVSAVAAALGAVLPPRPWRLRRLTLGMAHAASYAAGIAESAPELLPFVLSGQTVHPAQLRRDHRA